MASYYFFALLPAWEADHALKWTKSSTLTVNWMAELLEALGLLFAGPLADYIEPVQLIILEGLVAICGIFVTSTLQSATSVICATRLRQAENEAFPHVLALRPSYR